MRKFIIMCSLFAAGGASAGDAGKGLAQADALFDKGRYAQAVEAYETAAKTASGDEKYKALYRAIECRALSFKYAEAAEAALKLSAQGDSVWQGRFLLLKAEVMRAYLAQYGYNLPTDEEAGTADVTRRTKAQWEADINKAYAGLWALRAALAARELKGEAYFVVSEKADLREIGTLWDFAVMRWGEWILSGDGDAGKELPDAKDFLKDSYGVSFKPEGLPRAAMAGALYENASDLAAKNNNHDAEVLWQIKRLRIPFDHSNLTSLAVGGDITPLRKQAVKILDDWADNKKAGLLARAEALYQSARLSRELGELETTVATCKKLEDAYGRSNQGIKCAQMRAEIEMPSLDMTSSVVPPPGADSLRVNSRNVDTVFLRVYKTTREELEAIYSASHGRSSEDYYNFTLSSEMLKRYLDKKPVQSWSVKIKYPRKYDGQNTAVTPPALGKGIYVAVAANNDAFSAGRDLICGAILNVTELVLIGAEGILGNPADFVVEPGKPYKSINADAAHFYAVNGLTGQPAQDARITARGYVAGSVTRYNLIADKQGMAAIKLPFLISPHADIYMNLSPYAEHAGSLAYWQNQLGFGFTPEETLSLHTETDRPIYRPGQEVTFKTTVLERVPQGFRTYVGKNKIWVGIQDANGRTVKEFQLRPNSMGSVSASFKIPEKALLGQYHIAASLSDYQQDMRSDYAFSVEEYKRPEFEVKLDAPKEALRYGKPVTVKGEAVYYFGGGVQNAPVDFTVSRQVYIPWWHWLFGGFNRSGEEVASGSVTAGPDGKFSITFTPEPENGQGHGFPSVFVITANARDTSGRTISAVTQVTAGNKAYMFDIARDEGFIYTDGGNIKVSLQNLNGTAVNGKGSVKFYRVDKRPENMPSASSWGSFPVPPSIDSLFAHIENGPEVLAREVNFSETKPADIFFKPPKPGVYRITLTAPDPWGGTSEQSAIILCADKTDSTPLNLPPVTLARKSTVYEGDTAEILIGATAGKTTPLFVEVWAGQYLLKREMLAQGGIRVYKVKAGPEHKGGISLRWFAAKDFKFLSGQTGIKVPWRDKNLNVKFNYTKNNEPGAKVNWSVSVTDWQNKPVNAEASVRVYDRSLEYYEAAAPSWTAALYPERGYAGGSNVSIFTPYGVQLPVTKGWIELMMQAFRRRIDEPQPPYIKLTGSQRRSRGMFNTMAKGMDEGMMLSESFASAPQAVGGAMADIESAAAPSVSRGEMKKDKASFGGAPAEPPAPAAVPRTNFAETAYFNPFVKITAGKGAFRFTLPERLTSWKLGAVVLTKDIKTGVVSAEAVTAKALMARVLTPRFWREGDRSEIRLTVTNTTAKPVTGKAAIRITDGLKSVTAVYTSDSAEKDGTVPPGQSKTFIWPVRVPLGITALKITGSFSAGALADAEEQDLPILPGYDRVIRSVVKLIDRKTETLSIDNLPKDAFLETAFVQVDPQLASAVMNSLPQLVVYPHECTEQVLNRALPLAVTNRLYQKIPELREAVAKIPKRKTISPEWEQDNPLRQMGLEETPWLQRSKGGESSYPLIDLLDPGLVGREYASALEKLKGYQRPDGSFPWFPGGEGNLYMTLYVLDSFATASIYGVELPQDMLKRAMAYAVREIPKYMKPDTASLSFILYGAYTLTSYPDSWSETKTAKKYAKVWVEYVDKKSDALTQLGEAYAAWIYLRLGDKAKSEAYLDRAVDGARTGAEGSVSWTPEKISWYWYCDTLETHAFLLRTLVNLRPDSKLIKGMVLWMMVDRKTTEWKSTKAAAAAVYSMLEYMQKKDMLSGSTRYSVSWGDVKATATVSASDFLEKPLRWGLLGSSIKRSNATAVIEKEGKGMAFGSLTMVYTTRMPVLRSKGGMLEIERKYFTRKKDGKVYKLVPLKDGDTVKVGEELEVHLVISAEHQFEFMHIVDPKGAGFEFETLKSGWEWEKLARYTEPRDSRMNFFASWLPHGEYVLTYRMRPTTPGVYHIGPSVMQSMYAPEFAANSESINLTVTE